MRSHMRTIPLLFILFALTLSVGAALRRERQSTSPGKGQETAKESQIPITDYTAPEPTDEGERARVEAKCKKYFKYKDTVGPGVKTVHYFHWPPGFPTLPVAQSDAIAIGEVTGAKARLFANKRSVYSEFTVRLSQILKNDNYSELKPGRTIITERLGGRVRYPSEQISQFLIAGWGMPQVGGRYVLFLKRNDQAKDYDIVTGYELREGRVYPLDQTTSNETNFEAHTGSDEASFLNTLQRAIENSSQVGLR